MVIRSRAEAQRAWSVEVNNAQGRVGKSHEDRLRWALGFIVRDLSGLSPLEWELLRHEVAAFAVTPGPAANPGARLWLAEIVGGKYPNMAACAPIAREAVVDLQKEMARILRDLLNTGTAELGPYATTYIISLKEARIRPVMRLGVFGAPPKKSWLSNRSDGALPGLGTFAGLLGAFAYRLAVCPGCGTLFLGERANQAHCSSRCRNRKNVRECRARQAEAHRKKPLKDPRDQKPQRRRSGRQRKET